MDSATEAPVSPPPAVSDQAVQLPAIQESALDPPESDGLANPLAVPDTEPPAAWSTAASPEPAGLGSQAELEDFLQQQRRQWRRWMIGGTLGGLLVVGGLSLLSGGSGSEPKPEVTGTVRHKTSSQKRQVRGQTSADIGVNSMKKAPSAGTDAAGGAAPPAVSEETVPRAHKDRRPVTRAKVAPTVERQRVQRRRSHRQRRRRRAVRSRRSSTRRRAAPRRVAPRRERTIDPFAE